MLEKKFYTPAVPDGDHEVVWIGFNVSHVYAREFVSELAVTQFVAIGEKGDGSCVCVEGDGKLVACLKFARGPSSVARLVDP